VQFDVVIVGGGPAGIATALFLAHAAPERIPRILVLEKERYPREKICAGAIGARADRLLGSIGIQVQVPSAPVSGIALRALGRTLEVRGSAIGRVVRRSEFDHEFARLARARGIDVLDGQRVHALTRDESGWLVQSSTREFRARVLIGADGVTSVVRRALGFAGARYHAQVLEVDTEPVSSDLGREFLVFDIQNHALPGYYWDFPTLVGGSELMCRGVYLLKTGDADPALEIQEILAAELQARGLDLSRCRKKRFAERGFEVKAAYARRGALLVGEAAGIDPITGEGIAQAIQYGAVAGKYLARKLRDRDYEFDDWRAEIAHSMLGRDLLTRDLGLRLFYGSRRPQIERFLLDTPDFIRVGMQHFAGQPWSTRALLRSASSALVHATLGGSRPAV
jgi:menaquinone-9 beta-reductase